MPKIFSRLCSPALLFGVTLTPALYGQPASESQPASITINTRDPGTPFPHFWEQIFGSGRAILSFRQTYRDDLRTVKPLTPSQPLRFHAIFTDTPTLSNPTP